MARCHVAFYLPREAGEMAVAEALDFPGAVTQGFDLADARLMHASAMEDPAADAALAELVPLTVHVWGSASLKRHELLDH